MNPDLVTLSSASDDDCEFAFHAKKAAEGDLIRSHFDWDEKWERDYHSKEWTAARPSIIHYDGKRIGTLSVTKAEGYVEIGRFFILPEYQGRGIGSLLLGQILRDADRDGLPSRLAFLSGNRAESLYRRHGFAMTRQVEKLCYMERQPQRK